MIGSATSDASPVTLVWNAGTLGDWARLVASVPRSTLTQTFAYAQAMSRTHRYVPRLGQFLQGGRVLGVVQVLERTVLGVFRDVQIHRGPLWLEPDLSPDLKEAALAQLRLAYPRSLLQRLTFLPESLEMPEEGMLLSRAGFRRRRGEGYRTIWLDLSLPAEVLRSRLAPNWRNHLNAAERRGLAVEVDPEARALPWLVERHLADMRARRYRGPSGPLVIRLRNALHKDGNVLLLRALLDGEPEAGILILRHGQAATWQIGWSSVEGRALGAHPLLLWTAILRLQALGCRWFDLGGINPTAAAGVTTFKRGLRGEEVLLAGTWC